MKYPAAIATLRSSRFDTKRISTSIVLIAYFVYYVALIIKGQGIPYVLDNNESYSALLHAHNLWNFDFFESFGLADDVASPAPAAHPVVHTHQGDFPRLFTFILYAIGARSVESQIWITTFSVGLCSVLLAQAFFRRVAGDVFATIATLLLITDYILFAQWQVNTYRVWHAFFLFASLLCVHGLSDWNRRNWAIATICLYACLLYWELVFASFVAVTAGAYTVWIYRRTPRLIIVAGLTQSLGAAIGLGILITQVVLYLGWQDFLTDLKLTYGARNFGNDPLVAVQQLKDFYDNHNITFWYNISPDLGYRGIAAFLRSIFTNLLQVQTPLFVLIIICLASAVLIADSRLPNAQDAQVANSSVSARATAVLTAGLFCFLATAIFSADILGESAPSTSSVFSLLMPVMGLSLVFAPILSIVLRIFAAGISVTRSPPGFERCGIASIYFVSLAIFIFLQGFLYDQAQRSLWLDFLTPVPVWMAQLATALAAIVGGLLILSGRRSVLGSWYGLPTPLIPFFVSGAVGYLFVYELNAGYLYTGYLARFCPLFVFHIDAFLALGLYALFGTATAIVRNTHHLKSNFSMRAMASISGALIIALVSYWGFLQYRYINLVPPDQFAFTKTLKSLGNRSVGIISNTYAAPFGMIANTWAYMNADFAQRDQKQGMGATTHEYVWFADRKSNPIYRTPELFVCFEQPPPHSRLADQASRSDKTFSGCSKFHFSGQPNTGENIGGPQLKLIIRDEKSHLWAIYQISKPRSSQSGSALFMVELL
jgi:hypothetical protein